MNTVLALWLAVAPASALAQQPRAQPSSRQIAFVLGWNTSMYAIGSARGVVAADAWSSSEVLARALSVSLPTPPGAGSGTPQELAAAIKFVLEVTKQVGSTIDSRHDEKHGALFRLGLNLPLLSLLYAPASDETKALRLVLETHATKAELAPSVLAPLLGLVDRGGEGASINREVVALRKSVFEAVE